MEDKQLVEAARRAGILDSFINMTDDVETVSDDTRAALLTAMGRDPTDAPEVTPVPPVKVFTQGKKVLLTPDVSGAFNWQLTWENGEQSQGEIQTGEALNLGAALPAGYHQLTLAQNGNVWPCRIIVVPPRCYEPPTLRAGKKLWGATVQLYTLRSENNWGVGDFGDLKKMVEEVGKRGGAFVGLNPIHSLYPANPQSASPYSPSSRRWLNLTYIDVSAVEEFAASPEAQSWWNSVETHDALLQARSTDYVDYPLVMALKSAALKLAWPLFCGLPENTSRKQDFRRFVELGGVSLRQQALFDALHVHLRDLDLGQWGWPVWPQAYRDAQSADVAQFSERYASEVEFYQWQQWLAHTQFSACYQRSVGLKMPIGLYRDLAVGVAQGGAETWSDPALYCLNATIGAPPDILGPQGQNWGLPPIDPHEMKARAYQPFIDLLRANMAECGALRIDHVMGLLRLWWIPADQEAGNGAYVRYPLEDLLGVLALESQRHECMVIGEDLGTVPKEIIASLRDSGVYSYKVLYFEHDKNFVYRPPQDYVSQAMATVTTHDLPTLRGYWEGGDLTLGASLGVYPDPQVLEKLRAEREHSKQGLLEALHLEDCVPKATSKTAAGMPMTPVLNCGLQRYLAGSASALLGLQPEDWLDMDLPVNVPGTNTEYPNWRRKLTRTLEEMFGDEHISALLADLNRRRQAASTPSAKPSPNLPLRRGRS
ncbi:4-alpha-glucanotransferase [Rahnella woolbedingensis]|uniref:4-alpha-glucanotransferase n=1 Tax=Rahnella woolbedingensis TaxID=1510574 RepID=A0A419N1W0_9GAMM|nr:4-alpha-glucanotransferase [Rahnella woolbedingensis]RJT32031.1 4-alpha-glucanotransferase [Rahnella woolbedingensis]